MAEFDVERASLSDHDSFEPFGVQATQSLEAALARGEVGGDTPVLMLARNDGAVVLLTQQMAYHHVAQGELAGEPWLVSF